MLSLLNALGDIDQSGTPTNPTKFSLTAEGTKVTLNGHLNPTDLTIKRNAKWDPQGAATAEGAAPRPFYKFTGGDDTLTFTFTLDSSETPNDLTDELEALYDLTYPTKGEGDGKVQKRPPIVYFSWGKFNFQGIVDNVDIKVSLFSPKGHFKRASVTLTIKGDAFAKESRDAKKFMEEQRTKAVAKVQDDKNDGAGGGLAQLGSRMGRII